MKKKMKRSSGQALIPVLVIILIVLVLGVGSLHLSIGGMLVSASSQEGERVLMATEGALENGLLRSLRDPAYAGESLQVNGLGCTISVSGSAPTVVTAACDSGRALRKLQAEVTFTQGEMSVDNYQEIE